MEELHKECTEKLRPGELYLLMVGERAVSGYFKKSDDEVGEVDIHIHVGMSQDTVMVRYAGIVDFRYLLTGWISDEMKLYHWSESIDRVIIKNIGAKLNFISNDDTFVCGSGEELVVEREDYFNDVRLK